MNFEETWELANNSRNKLPILRSYVLIKPDGTVFKSKVYHSYKEIHDETDMQKSLCKVRELK